jgi:tetratricopeptide (TPR) repeat protein
MRCSKCGVENREAARFCDGCGSALQPQCVSCGALNRIGAKFCDGCGAALTGSASQVAATNSSGVRFSADIAAADVTEGERKPVTALFADIKGSMELMEDLDSEEARAIVDPALRLMIDAVHRYGGGYIVQSTGDGIFALFGAFALCIMGYPDRAVERSRQALALAGELSHPFSLAIALGQFAKLRNLRRDAEASFELAEQSLHVSTERGFKYWAAASKNERGWASIQLGRVDEGIAELQQVIAGAGGVELGMPQLLAALSNGYREANRVADGLSSVAQGLAISEKTGERWFDAELHRLRGELLLKEGAQAGSNAEVAAQTCFGQALEIAQRQRAKWWELRATKSLARLLAKRGRRDEARTMLADIYKWFTEGFDTPDLRDAKALLEEFGNSRSLS